MERVKVLFSRNTRKQLITWIIKIDNQNTHCNLIMDSGLLFGKKKATIEKITEGKNIGKANETSIQEQAYLRFLSRIEDKKKRGYKEVPMYIEEDYLKSNKNNFQYLRQLEEEIALVKTDNEGFVKPMKAAQYFKSKKDWTDETGKTWKDKKYYLLNNPDKAENSDIRIKFPCLIQPKINGVRALISYDENHKCVIRSKEGKIYDCLTHIEDFFNDNFSQLAIFSEIVYDGELYINNESLQNIASAVKKTNFDTPNVYFYCYDLAVSDMPNFNRFRYLKLIISKIEESKMYNIFRLIRTHKVNTNNQVQEMTNNYIALGYEGSILRTLNDNYHFGSRKSNMVKLKRLMSNEFKIKDVIPQPKAKNQGMFLCTTKSNKIFKVNPTFSNEFKEEILENKEAFIGKYLQCSFYEYTDDMKPFHIVDTTIRDYE